MPRSFRFAIAILCFSLAARAHGEPILDHVPPDAMGFAMVHNLTAANAKVEKFLKIFEGLSNSPLPAPWPFAKAATGLGEGLNEEGDALIALLSGPDGPGKPRPMVLVAVADYAKFAESVGGDPSGEIARVTIAGEEVLAARRGDYAMLMNVEHRPVMESVLASEPTNPESLTPLKEWMATADLTVVLTPMGVDLLTQLGHSTLAEKRAQLERSPTDPALAAAVRQLRQAVEFYDMILDFFGAEIDVVAIGLSIDDDTNVRLAKRLVLKKGGAVAGWGDAPQPTRSALAGFPAEPFVFGGGGPTPAAWSNSIAGAIRKLTERFADESGFENFTDDQWKQVEDSWKAMLEGVRATSMVMLPGDKEDPLMSNFFYVTKVDDAEQYLQSTRQSYELWNSLLEKSSLDLGMQMKYEFEDVEIAGHKGLIMTADVGQVVDDAQLPMFGAVMKSFFGEDGKFRVHVIAADDTTVVSALADKERIEQAIDDAVKPETGLAENSHVQATAMLLEDDTPWRWFVSPQGVVRWMSRMLSVVLSQFGAGAPEVPDFPESPPVGLSWTLEDGQLHAEMVWPRQTLEQLAAYIEKLKGDGN